MNRGVLVTGASTGIGAAIAQHLAGRGFRVFGTFDWLIYRFLWRGVRLPPS